MCLWNWKPKCKSHSAGTSIPKLFSTFRIAAPAPFMLRKTSVPQTPLQGQLLPPSKSTKVHAKIMETELPSLSLSLEPSIADNASLSELLHLSVKAESFGGGAQSTGQDCLRDEFRGENRAGNDKPILPLRNLYFIIDTSAFLQGMGNVKRWFDAEYATSQIKKNQGDGAETVKLHCYIPLNTLNELNHFKRNSSIEGPNAARALKFIDHVLDLDDGISPYDDTESKGDGGVIITYDVEVEARSPAFPTWNTALRYAVRKDRLHEVDVGSKFLIRSCVSKAFLGKKHIEGSWHVISEDKARHCTNLVGINCLNVNEAELLLFRALDVTLAQPRAPGAGFNYQYDMYDNTNIMTKIDTSCYGYSRLANQNGHLRKVDENAEVNVSRNPGGIVEDFDMVSYAPRPEGKIWTPALDLLKNKKKKNRYRRKKSPKEKTVLEPNA